MPEPQKPQTAFSIGEEETILNYHRGVRKENERCVELLEVYALQHGEDGRPFVRDLLVEAATEIRRTCPAKDGEA